MSHFDRALAFVLYNEGGYSQDPEDLGGPTNFGITQATLSQWFGTSVSADDVKALSRDKAAEIYADMYWGPVGGYLLKQFPVAAAIFDAGVLFGVGTSTRLAQRAVNACYPTLSLPLLQVDGHIGPKSIDALNSVSPGSFTRNFVSLLLNRIGDVVNARPQNLKFRAGWERRINRYLTLTPEGGWHL